MNHYILWFASWVLAKLHSCPHVWKAVLHNFNRYQGEGRAHVCSLGLSHTFLFFNENQQHLIEGTPWPQQEDLFPPMLSMGAELSLHFKGSTKLPRRKRQILPLESVLLFMGTFFQSQITAGGSGLMCWGEKSNYIDKELFALKQQWSRFPEQSHY